MGGDGPGSRGGQVGHPGETGQQNGKQIDLMKKSKDGIKRRRFVQTMAAAGLCPLLSRVSFGADRAPAAAPVPELKPVTAKVPRRILGKTKTEIACIGAGMTMGLNSPTPLPRGEDKAILARCLDWGITYWDTSASYTTEPLMGEFFRANKGARDKVFICTKVADITTPLPIISDVQQSLENSLKTLGTDYIDLFMGVHAMPKPDCLTDELRQFAENAKKKGMIKFFGFSNHANMANNLAAAAKLNWIDAILVAYNYRQVNNAPVQAALDACVKANIGLVAIKSQGWGSTSPMTAEEEKLTAHFTDKGFDDKQAKLKLVLEDKRFTAVSVGMKRLSIVESVGAAATDNAKLARADRRALEEHASATCSGYCAGCAQICGGALPELPLLSDVMRCLMYSRNYREHELARGIFARLPAEAKARLLAADYRQAERLCPQGMPIGVLVAEAVRLLA
jgi:aryl-alcohol dehydrogenase-like predicted oxidoreductase